MENTLIKVSNISKHFPLSKREYLTAVNEVSLDIKQGDIIGVVGESGCGKTTLGKLILNLDTADEGDFNMSQLRLIQRFPDEFSPDNYRNLVEENGHSAVEAETVVVTNSDYIVERLLGSGELCNISGADLSGRDPGYSSVKYTFPGEGQKLVYGCICRRGEELSEQGKDFLGFVKERLQISGK